VRRIAGALLLAALAWGPAAPARAANPDCGASYKADDEAAWAITRGQWDSDCAAGLAPDDILRKRQKTFMDECAAYYRPFLVKASVPDWNLQVYCAQGAAGENALSAMSGAPPRRAPPAPPAPPAAEARKAPGPAANQATRFYNLIDTAGAPYPEKLIDLLPKELSLTPLLRYNGTHEYEIFVARDRRPPLCILHLEVFVGVPVRCGEETYMSDLYDSGCTGRVSSMRIVGQGAGGKVPKHCTQKQVDVVFAALEDRFRQQHPGLMTEPGR
jgi:hypothetical protein